MNLKNGFERQSTRYGLFNNIFKATHECEYNLIILACFHEQKFNLLVDQCT